MEPEDSLPCLQVHATCPYPEPAQSSQHHHISLLKIHFNVVCFLLGDSPAADLYMPTFRNTLSVPSSKAGVKMEQIECSETSAYINQTPGNHPKENKQHSEHGESLKSRIHFNIIPHLHSTRQSEQNLWT